VIVFLVVLILIVFNALGSKRIKAGAFPLAIYTVVIGVLNSTA